MEIIEAEKIAESVKAILQENRRLKEENEQLKARLGHIAALARSEIAPTGKHSIFNESIETLDLAVRSGNCLEGARVETIGALVRMSESDLLQIRSFGRTGLRELIRKLDALGLHLHMTDEDILAWQPPQS